MKFKVAIVFLLLIIILIPSCDTTEPPPPNGEKPTLTLKFEETSCIEAWIKLTTTNLLTEGEPPAEIILKQNDIVRDTISLTTADTLLYIDSLLPNTNYTFQAAGLQSPVSGVKSNSLNVTTMDTTSHILNWQVFTFGEHQHSRLNDVAIVGDEIWAVGEIYMNDSLGQSIRYNAVHWNGNEWDLKRIYYYGSCSAVEYPPLKAIWAISENNIVVTNGGSIGWFNGNTISLDCGVNPLLTGAINKISGTSSQDIFVVGNDGNIAHYDGNSWIKLDSGTNVDLLDIFGTEDGTLWTCGYTSDYAVTTLLSNAGNGWETVYEGSGNNQSNGYYIGPISGVWGANKYRIYMMNWGGIYIQANSNELFLEKKIAKFSDVGFGIDGTDDNNIFACGEGFVGHWNGISYTEYPELYKDFRAFKNVVVKGNTVCAVGRDYNGFTYSEAVIALSK
jgi:hypothetical protein